MDRFILIHPQFENARRRRIWFSFAIVSPRPDFFEKQA